MDHAMMARFVSTATLRLRSGAPSLFDVPKWEHEPTSSGSQPDVVPSKELRPLGQWDRMANGQQLGRCPTCDGGEWWDNRSRKAAGQMKPQAPDYVCAVCRHARWIDGSSEPGRLPAGRTPTAWKTTVLPVSTNPQCDATKPDGTRCRNRPMRGSRFCGPHAEAGGATERRGPTKVGVESRAQHQPVEMCAALKRDGTPCRNRAMAGSTFCGPHARA